MITLTRIDAQNFRSLGHAVVEPLTDGGLTALNGPNGAGKSSMLGAVLFALYAVTPDGVPIKALRRQGSTDPVKVEVTFTHDGQSIVVERGLKGVKDSHYARITVDGIEQVFGKVTAATSWVEARLGLDKEGFLTAFAIRQKELDGLVRAKPAERRALIERLAGIERMSTAVQTARAEENDAKRVLDLLPGSGEDLTAARAALDEAQSAAIEVWDRVETTRAAREDAQQHWESVKANAETLSRGVEAHRAAAAKVTDLTQTAQIEDERARAAANIVATLEADAQGGSADDVAAAEAAVTLARDAVQGNREAQRRAAEAAEHVGREQQRVTQVTDRAARLAREVASLRTRANDADKALSAVPADLDAQVAAAQQGLDAVTAHLGGLRGEHARLDASIRALSASTDPTCPTCATSLPDPGTLLTSLRESLARVAGEGADAAAAEKAARERVQDLTAQHGKAQRVRSDAEYAHAELDRATASLAEAEQEATAARGAWESLRATAETTERAATEARENAATVEADLAAAERTLRTVQVAANAQSRLGSARTDAQQASQRAHEAHAAVDAARAEADALAIPEEQITAAREEFRSAQAAVHAAAMDAERAESDHRVSIERVASAERTRDAEDAKVRARVEARTDYERKVAVRTALDSFRKERIAAIAPELSEAATDLIPRLTDGKFVAVTLDEEFTAIVTDHLGQQRPAAWLSGGEESAVALALRLALGEIIAGAQGGLLWMDEPQTAMDAERRPAMMSTIRSIPGRQPIIISHVSEASDMVDLVLDVVPDPDFGSTVVVAGQGDASRIDADPEAA